MNLSTLGYNNEGINRAKKPDETATSESSYDDFVSNSSAHLMRIKTLKRATDTVDIWDRQKHSQEQLAYICSYNKNYSDTQKKWI